MARRLATRVQKLEQQLAPTRLRAIDLIQRVLEGTATDEDLAPWQTDIELVLARAAAPNED